MGILGEMKVVFGADTSGLTAGFGQAKSGISGFVGMIGQLGPVGGAIAAIGGAAIGFGAASVKSAADFQQSMLKVQALAGYTQKQANDMGNAILQMATQVGQSPKSLADGLYFVASAGFKGADALNILKLSAMAAATGGFDTKTAADALTSALNAFQVPAAQASNMMAVMSATVSAGKMEFGNYANVIGKLSVASKASGVTFEESNAALATLTNSGYTAQNAGTLLAGMFVTLDLKTDKMAATAKKLGVSFDEQKFKSMSLGDQMAYLEKVTGGNQGTLLKLMGGNSNALKTFDALHGSVGTYNTNLTTLNDAYKKGTATQDQFAITQQGFNFQLKQAGAAFDVVKIAVGNALLPVLGNLLKMVTPIISGFGNFVTHLTSAKGATDGFNGVIKWLGDFMKATVVPIWDQFQKTFKDQVLPVINQVWADLQPLLPTLGDIATMLGGLVAGAVQTFIKIWGDVMQILGGVIQFVTGFVAFFYDLFTGHFNKLGNDLKSIWDGIKNIFGGAFKGIQDLLNGAISNMQKAWGAVGTALQNVGQGILNALEWPFQQAWNGIQKIWGGLGNVFKGIINSIPGASWTLHALHVPGFAQGVQNFAGGLAMVGENGPEMVYLPGGSNVYPNSTLNSPGSPAGGIGGQGAGQLTVEVYLDGRAITNVLGPRIVQMVRAQGPVSKVP